MEDMVEGRRKMTSEDKIYYPCSGQEVLLDEDIKLNAGEMFCCVDGFLHNGAGSKYFSTGPSWTKLPDCQFSKYLTFDDRQNVFVKNVPEHLIFPTCIEVVCEDKNSSQSLLKVNIRTEELKSMLRFVGCRKICTLRWIDGTSYTDGRGQHVFFEQKCFLGA